MNGQLMQMERRVYKYLLGFIVIVLINSCTNGSDLKEQKLNLEGKWKTDSTDKNCVITITIDNLSKQLSVDYSNCGGKLFTDTYTSVGDSLIESNILPRGAKVRFINSNEIMLYPTDNAITKDIESIYMYKFIRQ